MRFFLRIEDDRKVYTSPFNIEWIYEDIQERLKSKKNLIFAEVIISINGQVFHAIHEMVDRQELAHIIRSSCMRCVGDEIIKY